ncbi:hypothetical protein OC846_006435, partial [Tilletia horrida]
ATSTSPPASRSTASVHLLCDKPQTFLSVIDYPLKPNTTTFPLHITFNMNVPTEILSLIFERVEDYFDLKALQATCKQFRSVLDDARFDGPLFRLIARNSNTSDVAAPSEADDWFDDEGKPFEVKLHPLLNDSKYILSVVTEHKHQDGLPIDEAATNPALPELELFWPVQDFDGDRTHKPPADDPVKLVTVGQMLDGVLGVMWAYQVHFAMLERKRIHWTGLILRAEGRQFEYIGKTCTIYMVPHFTVGRKVEKGDPEYTDLGEMFGEDDEDEEEWSDCYNEEEMEDEEGTEDEHDEDGGSDRDGGDDDGEGDGHGNGPTEPTRST